MHNTQVCMFCRYRRTTAGAGHVAPCCADRREERHAGEAVAPASPAPRKRPPRRSVAHRH